VGRLGVSVEKENEIRKIMRRLKIFEKDIKESFVRSSGPGGQNVNKVSTCVTLMHVPTGIQVKCQKSRIQSTNRLRARYLLIKKIEQKIHDEHLHNIQKREKLRRQKRKRPRHLKEEILQKKHQQSEKKNLRKKITMQKIDDYA